MIYTIILFVILQLINVVLSTCKSIITVKGTVHQSACINALSYGLYTVIVVFMAGEFTGNYWVDLAIKVVSTVITNLIGVHISAWILNKFRKDRLWKIEVTICGKWQPFQEILEINNISYNYIKLKDNEVIFNIYSKNQSESLIIKTAMKNCNAKYIITESERKL